MTQEVYEKVCKNIKIFISKYIDERDDFYLYEYKERIIEKYINELCNETKIKMKYCTEKETEAYRKLMGIDSNGELKTYKQVCDELNKTNVKQLIFNANRKMTNTIYQEILLEDKVKHIQLNFKYSDNKGMLLPENIEIDNLSSIIYYEYELLKKNGIKNIGNIIEYTITEVLAIIQVINSKRKGNKSEIATELINTIHILGFLFKNEEGYDEQQVFFEKIRTIINYPTRIYYSNEDINIKRELYIIKDLIAYLNRLITQKEQFSTELNEINKEIEKTKEKIIKSESKIRTINIKHR